MAQDFLSKWPEVKAVPQTSDGIGGGRIIQEHIFARFGCPIELVTDQGTEFLGEVNKILMRGRGIHRTTSAYRAQANGMVEHLNNVTSRALAAALENGDLQTWEAGLLDFLMGYKGFRHSTTGKSPHQILMSRPMRLPWKFHATPRPLLPVDSPDALAKHMTCRAESLKLLQDTAREANLKR